MPLQRNRGFTLVELMIALVLGLILTGGVISLFLQNRQSFRVDESVARMQDEARFAMQELARDARMASFIAEPLVPGAIFQDASLAVGTDCGDGTPNWIYSLVNAGTDEITTLTTLDNVTGAAAAGSYACIDAGEIRGNTDLIAIKRVAGHVTAAAALEDGGVYLRSNGTFGLLYVQPPVAAMPAPFADWEYRPRIYYIRNFAETAGDGIPTLCRKILVPGSPPSMETDCIARGIEDLQLEFGIDTDGDGVANRYSVDPTLAALQRAVSVRISLLARTTEADFGYTDDRTYNLSNAPAYTPNDNFHRRAYSITVTVHNLRNLRRLGVGA